MRKLENKINLFGEILPSLDPLKCYVQLRNRDFYQIVSTILRVDGYEFEEVSTNTFLVSLP